jgi:hypothetical protein
MTDQHDDATRDLVQRAHHNDPEPADLDIATGLADVLARSGQQAPSWTRLAVGVTRPSVQADPTRGDGPAQKGSSDGDRHAPESALLDHLQRYAEESLVGAKAAREEARARATARKEVLAEEAERIGAESTQWKAGGDRLRAILDEWKTIKGVDRKVDEVLWRRFSKARDAFARRRGTHFAELDRQRVGARARKEELVVEAEKLASSTDWGATASRFRNLMTEWKAAGRTPKEADDALWQRFRTAQESFFTARSTALSGRDSEMDRNVARKEELLAAAERIDPTGDIEAARTQLRSIQERWEAVGKVPRERVRDLEARLRAAEEGVRTAAHSQWRHADPEFEARVAQFQERVEQYEAQAAKARAAGDDRRASTAQAQADQWREWLAAAERAVTSR